MIKFTGLGMTVDSFTASSPYAQGRRLEITRCMKNRMITFCRSLFGCLNQACS